ncbi:MAG TPA: twin-arginine translocation signal domain-containing protein [Candidatus Competibacteraceae bacterium]|nr:twin-arginine translocation signal domain-containing protein [Candidatus Competibacteraceae bacterium]
MTTRREFLKTGLAGAALLNVAACSRPSENGGRTMVLSAVIPVMLAGALPAGDEARQELVVRTVAGVDRAIAGLSLPTQKEIGELFDLLAFPLTRMLAAGVWSSWPDATPEAIGNFLESWRHSRFDLLKSGYAALHDLIFGAWYARPDTWAAIAYPGPPEVK